MELKIFVLWFLLAPNLLLLGQNIDSDQTKKQKDIWHVKAMHPDGYTMDVKAFDSKGVKYEC